MARGKYLNPMTEEHKEAISQAQRKRFDEMGLTVEVVKDRVLKRSREFRRSYKQVSSLLEPETHKKLASLAKQNGFRSLHQLCQALLIYASEKL